MRRKDIERLRRKILREGRTWRRRKIERKEDIEREEH